MMRTTPGSGHPSAYQPLPAAPKTVLRVSTCLACGSTQAIRLGSKLPVVGGRCPEIYGVGKCAHDG